MAGWWRRNPFFVSYMAREVTALFVAGYALILVVGLLRLSQGEAAYNEWLQALKSPLSLAFHAVLLATFVYHTWSWFRIMPKTMPVLKVGGKKVEASTITNTGLAAAAACSLALLLAVIGVMR
jgi:fumarate reductase subunit C